MQRRRRSHLNRIVPDRVSRTVRRALARVTFATLAALGSLCSALPASGQTAVQAAPVVEAPAQAEAKSSTQTDGKGQLATDTWGSGSAPETPPTAAAPTATSAPTPGGVESVDSDKGCPCPGQAPGQRTGLVTQAVRYTLEGL